MGRLLDVAELELDDLGDGDFDAGGEGEDEDEEETTGRLPNEAKFLTMSGGAPACGFPASRPVKYDLSQRDRSITGLIHAHHASYSSS